MRISLENMSPKDKEHVKAEIDILKDSLYMFPSIEIVHSASEIIKGFINEYHN